MFGDGAGRINSANSASGRMLNSSASTRTTSSASSTRSSSLASGTPVSLTSPAQQLATITFNTCKKETFSPGQGLSKLRKRLRNNYKVETNNDPISVERLRQADVYVLCGPRDKFLSSEFEAMKQYVQEGGNLLFMIGEGGEQGSGTNINYFLEEFGICVNADAVVQTSYIKYHHPKEALVTTGILNREINRAAGKRVPGSARPVSLDDDDRSTSKNLEFAFPYGATLNVQPPAVPILSSGFTAYPINRPVGAVYSQEMDSRMEKEPVKGRIAVLGSVHMFNDDWLEESENKSLQRILFEWLLRSPNIALNTIDARAPEVNDYQYQPEIETLSNRLRACLQESEPLPRDHTKLFDTNLFKFDTSLIPESVALYEKLDVKHDPLTLIVPQFEVPLPALTPAVFPPIIREPPPPALDLFDLDEQFASERVRLAHLTNMCTNDDLTFYIQQSAEILGVASKLKPEHRESPKHIVEYLFKQVVHWKKLNHEQPNTMYNNEP